MGRNLQICWDIFEVLTNSRMNILPTFTTERSQTCWQSLGDWGRLSEWKTPMVIFYPRWNFHHRKGELIYRTEFCIPQWCSIEYLKETCCKGLSEGSLLGGMSIGPFDSLLWIFILKLHHVSCNTESARACWDLGGLMCARMYYIYTNWCI